VLHDGNSHLFNGRSRPHWRKPDEHDSDKNWVYGLMWLDDGLPARTSHEDGHDPDPKPGPDPGPDPEVPTLMGSMMSTTKPLSSRLLSIDTTEKPTTNTTLTLKPPSATQTRHSFSKRLDAQHIDIANLPPIQQPHH
jgi:hypothetical protein